MKHLKLPSAKIFIITKFVNSLSKIYQMAGPSFTKTFAIESKIPGYHVYKVLFNNCVFFKI